MAFDLKSCYGFGSGANFQDYEVEAGEVFDNFNSYALLTDINANLITIDIEGAYIGQFGSFRAGEVILIHASSSPTMQTEKLGKFICAKIELANGGTLTLDKNISTTFDDNDINNYYIQAVSFAEFHCLKIKEGGAVTPQIYSSTAHHGGIFAVKVSDVLELSGVIDLTDKGISTYQKDFIRPITMQEMNGTLDADPQAGKENYCDNNIFLLNSGDGAAFIFAKNITADKDARIGNPATHGKLNCRGAKDTKYKPSNITNVGGSSIFICVDKKILYPETLAKYRTVSDSDAKKGKGLARCYIATQDYQRDYNDALFHLDLISDYARVSRDSKIFDYGRGRNNSCDNPTFRLNTVAGMLKLTDNSAKIMDTTEKGLATFTVGTRCWIGYPVVPEVNEIVAVENDVVTFKNALTGMVFVCIAMPEFEDLTLTQDFEDVFFVFVKNNCKITGKIKGDSVIIAKNFEVGANAWLGDKVFCVYENLIGSLENKAPEGSLIIQQASY